MRRNFKMSAEAFDEMVRNTQWPDVEPLPTPDPLDMFTSELYHGTSYTAVREAQTKEKASRAVLEFTKTKLARAQAEVARLQGDNTTLRLQNEDLRDALVICRRRLRELTEPTEEDAQAPSKRTVICLDGDETPSGVVVHTI